MSTVLPVLSLLETLKPVSAQDVSTSNANTNVNVNANQNASSSVVATQEQPVDVKSLSLDDYNSWIDQMLIDKGLYKQANSDVNGDGVVDENDKTVKKTHINNENEANFAEYAAALDDWLKEAVINGGSEPGESEGIDADEQAIYEKLAGIFQNGHVLKTNDFMAYARQMGFEIQGSYMETGYIVDNKADGNYHKDIKEGGHIYVMTITDPTTGADIVIADANGNASIEVEELFLNEILTGLSTQIDPANFGKYTYIASSDSGDGASVAKDGETLKLSSDLDKTLKEDEKAVEDKAKKDKKAKKQEEKEVAQQKTSEKATNADAITQNEYDKLEKEFIEEYIEEMQDDVDYKDLTVDELEEIAQEKAEDYMKDNYCIQ